MNIYFVRHGETDFNAAKIHQHPEVKLSKNGIKQVESVGKRFRKIEIDIILSSDSLRAKHTAEIISKIINKDIIFTEKLRERIWPSEIIGKKIDDQEVKNIKSAMHLNSHDSNWHYSNEENIHELMSRAKEFIAFVNKLDYQNVLVVTHSKILKTIIAALIFGDGLTIEVTERIDEFLTTKNTGITWCRKDVNNVWELVTWNDHSHLG